MLEMHLPTDEFLATVTPAPPPPIIDESALGALSGNDFADQYSPNIGQNLPTATRKARAGRQAAKQLLQASQVETPPEMVTVDTASVETSQPAPHQRTGRIALQEALPVPASEPDPVVKLDDFEDICTRFQGPVVRYLHRMVGNHEEADDLAQETFLKAWRALKGGDGIHAGALSTWLFRIATNTATDALRRRKLINWLPLSIFNDDRGIGISLAGGGPTNQSSNRGIPSSATPVGSGTNSYGGNRFEDRLADQETVGCVLGKLPEKYRATLLLYEHQGYTVKEVAEVLQITPSAVKMRLMRAREHFIKLYKQEGGEVPGQVFVPRKPGRKVQKSKQPASVVALA